MHIDDPATDPFELPREPSFGSVRIVGMVLFLLALAMLFGASLFGYIWTRFAGSQSPPRGSIQLPKELWLSTVLVIGVSIALALATGRIREGQVRASRNCLIAALALAAGFLTVQAPALYELLSRHYTLLHGHGTHLYGLIFFLVLLHALHVVGGMVSLIMVTFRAHKGGFDRASGTSPIRLTTLYWHFLDVVWLVMFGTLLAFR
jgi:heme/copper-type cytochrome/quinol oxidase subunit 3